MRILHVIESLDPACGGPPEIAASLAAACGTAGHHVTIASKDGNSPAARRLVGDIPGFDRVNTVEVPPSPGPIRGLIDPTVRRAFEPIVAGQDVVHLHNVWDGILVSAATACRGQGVPYVVLVNGMLDTWSLAQRALKKKFAMLTTHRALLRRAAGFHCGNLHERDTVAALALGPPTFIVPNGLWLERVDVSRNSSAFRSKHPELRDDPFVLFMSRLHHKKGLDYLMDAFDRVAADRPTVRLAIAGPDGGELAPLRERIAASPAASRVHLLGPLYGDEKFAALAECACFCLPSRQEGFPMAVLEALGSRAPTVISEQCHVDEVASAGAGFVVPLEAERIAQAIGQIVDTPDARGSFGAAGRRLIEARYTWPRVAETALEMYEGIVSKPTNLRPTSS